MSLLSHVLSLPASAAGIDLSRATAELDRALHGAGCKTVSVPRGLGYLEARMGTAAMATTALEGERVSLAVLSNVRAAPFFGSIVLVVHPRPTIDAPLLVADMSVVPPRRARAYLDVCGPAIARPEFKRTFFPALTRALGATNALAPSPVPSWIAPLSGGCGAVVRARGNTATQLFGLALRYVETYLACLSEAPAAADAESNAASQRSVADVVRAHGRAGRMLSRAFGPASAARYSRLLWNEDR